MFSHLKAEDFVNLLEGGEWPAQHRSHIDSCSRCHATWISMQSVHGEITTPETDIPEPDWLEFRSSVRNELLSRSIQRQSAVQRWTGWSIRPAAAWALSLVLAVGITAIAVLWQTTRQMPEPAAITAPVEFVVAEPSDLIEAEPERSLFADVVSLGEEEQEQFQRLLESAEAETRQQ